jgi:hypothetical protein
VRCIAEQQHNHGSQEPGPEPHQQGHGGSVRARRAADQLHVGWARQQVAALRRAVTCAVRVQHSRLQEASRLVFVFVKDSKPRRCARASCMSSRACCMRRAGVRCRRACHRCPSDTVRRKVAIPVPDSHTWEQFLGQVRGRCAATIVSCSPCAHTACCADAAPAPACACACACTMRAGHQQAEADRRQRHLLQLGG